jgi:hypothetical protein
VLFAISAPTFFFGEFWTGVLLGIAGFIGFIALILFLDDQNWWPMRDTFDYTEDELPGVRGAGEGVLVADFLDAEVLESIAQQKKIDPEPKESETGSSASREASVGMQKMPIIGKYVGSKSQEQKQKFVHRKDHNVMLAAVLKQLEKDNELRRDLDEVPGVSIGDDHVMEQLAEMAEEHAEAKTTREGMFTLRSRLMAEEKQKEYDRAVEAGELVLVEGKWEVRELVDGGARKQLRLKQLREHDDFPSNPPEYKDAPDGVALVVNFDTERLTDQGKDRFAVNEQRAAVFGTPSSYANGTLTVSPVAIFGRFSVPSAERPPYY